MNQNRLTGRRIVRGLATLALGCTAVLAGQSMLSAPTAHAKIEPPILRISMEAEPLTFDWNDTRSASDRFILSFITRGLLKYDSSANLVCDLCASFRISEDKKTLHFDLDPQAVWSDGVPVEAQQFVDSFRRLLDPANGFAAASEFDVIAGTTQPGKKWTPEKVGVRAETKHKLQIELSRPFTLFPHFLTTIASAPIRKEFLSPKDTGEEQATMAALGPYQLAGWERGKRIVLEGNPKFAGARPVYRVEFILGAHAEQITRFQAGKLDIVTSPTTEDILKLPGQKVQVSPFWATRSIIFNAQRGPAADLHLRRSVLYSLDRNTLPAFLKTGERKATGVIPPGLIGHRELPLATLDPSRAAAEKAQTGKPKSTASRLQLLVLDSDQDRRVGTWLGGQLEKVGIRLDIQLKKSAEYFRALESAQFDAAIIVSPFRIATPLELLLHFRTQARTNYGRWTHVAYDALLDRLLNEKNQTESTEGASAMIDQVCRILEIEGVAVIPLGYPTQPFVLGRRVESFATTPFGDPDLVKIRLKQ